MDRYHRIRRLRADLTALPGIALAYNVADPADCRGTSGSRCSWPTPAQAPEWNKHPPLPVHGARISAVVVGMAPWQIALIAAAALLATALVVIAGRRRRARRRQTAAA
jgi:hypothetical protein